MLVGYAALTVAAQTVPELPTAFHTTFQLSTNAAKLGEVPDDSIEVSVDYHTDGTWWRASYYNGLQVDMHVPQGNFKETYRNGKPTCVTTDPDILPWQNLHVLPVDLDSYVYVGEATVRNLRVEKWILPVPQNETRRGKKTGMHFYFNRASETPVRWTIDRARNPIFDAHCDMWNIDYIIFEPGPSCDMILEAPLNCENGIILPALELFTRPRGLKKRKKNLRRTGNWSPPAIDVPERLDWHEKGFAGPVKDQGFCGSCWAFSMTSTVATTYALDQFRRGNKVEIPLLAEQKIVDCGWTTDSLGCDGGDYDDPELMGIELPLSEDYGGYLSVNGRCHEAKPFVKVEAWVRIQMQHLTQGEKELAMRRALFLHGPLSVNLFCPATLLFYREGVFDDPLCANIEAETTNHAVVLVGYGDDASIPYWKVKNSWSVAWGEDGFIRIARARDCGLTTNPGFPRVTASNSSSALTRTPEDEAARELLT